MTRDELSALCEERLGLAEKATPGPWINAGADMRCANPAHRPTHPGPPECQYTFQGWKRGDFFGSYVSSEHTHEEVVGGNDYGPVLSGPDAQFIAHAGTHDLALMRAVLELLEEVSKS